MFCSSLQIRLAGADVFAGISGHGHEINSRTGLAESQMRISRPLVTPPSILQRHQTHRSHRSRAHCSPSPSRPEISVSFNVSRLDRKTIILPCCFELHVEKKLKLFLHSCIIAICISSGVNNALFLFLFLLGRLSFSYWFLRLGEKTLSTLAIKLYVLQVFYKGCLSYKNTSKWLSR